MQWGWGAARSGCQGCRPLLWGHQRGSPWCVLVMLCLTCCLLTGQFHHMMKTDRRLGCTLNHFQGAILMLGWFFLMLSSAVNLFFKFWKLIVSPISISISGFALSLLVKSPKWGILQLEKLLKTRRLESLMISPTIPGIKRLIKEKRNTDLGCFLAGYFFFFF